MRYILWIDNIDVLEGTYEECWNELCERGRVNDHHGDWEITEEG
jgi:hypothetical protein